MDKSRGIVFEDHKKQASSQGYQPGHSYILGKNGLREVQITPYQTMDCGLSELPDPDEIMGK